MKHTIRINGEIKQIDCEFGSNVRDKNGREIVEGDKVRALTPNGELEVGAIIFDTGTFMWATPSWTTELDSSGIYDLEIVEHVDD